MSSLIKKIPYAILGCYLAFCSALLYWVVIYSGSGDGDTLEHVHSSWLVYSGKIPYKDFFQHHNPLLWYVGAPVVGLFEYSLRAVDAANMLTVTVTIITLFYIYRLNKDFLSTSLGGLIAASFFMLPQESLYNKDFKPDNFMTSCLIIGLYYLCRYVKSQRLSSLVVSFLMFFAAFMFTQKALLALFAIGLVVLYLIYQKKISFSDCLFAALLPLMLYAAFLAFLYQENVLEMYYKANFELNTYIPAVFHTRRFIHPSAEMFVPILLSLYALARVFYNGDIYIKIIGFAFIAELLIRIYYFTPFVYYFAFLHAIASVFAGVAAVSLINRYRWAVWLFLTYFMVLGGIYAHIYSRRITVGDSFKYGAAGLVLENTTPCDYVLNGYRIGYNLFNKDVDYIWNLLGQIDVIAAQIGIRPTADLEILIRKYRPKIIYGKNYYDTYREYRGDIGVYPIHHISTRLLDEMYTPLNRDDLYILKPEYQKYDCRYNPRTKTYEYRDMN
ncbi:MAG: glycosyltransferase family 39 protein [Alphaproteobacteria bacterium]|nr:glycosyltransferase family 39 protein [Alphaproteobacteria bacterium]